MDSIKFIETVRERDIDLLIMEEVFCSELFRNSLLEKFNLKADCYTFWGCWHSIMDNELGETDILVGFKDSSNNRTVIMIENKIDVSFQHMQAERYLKRGQKGVENGLWDNFHICLTAPQLYINGVDKKQFKQFKHFISYEEILEIIKQSNLSENRNSFKINMLETAIDKKKRGYSFLIDEVVTNFWQNYYKVIELNYPSLKSKKPSVKPSKSDWYHFRNPILERPFSIIHKWKFGCVDLQIEGFAIKLDDIEKALVLPKDTELIKTGKSLSIRKKCLPINKFESFESQYENILLSLSKVQELLDIYNKYKNDILKI